MRGREGAHQLDVVLDPVGVVQVALQHLQSARRRVDMGVLEPGHDHAVRRFDDLGARPDEVGEVRTRPDRRDPAASDCHGIGGGAAVRAGAPGPHPPGHQQRVGRTTLSHVCQHPYPAAFRGRASDPTLSHRPVMRSATSPVHPV